MASLLQLIGWIGLLLQPPATAPQKPAPADHSGNEVSATITLRDVDIAQLLEKADLEVGYSIGGRVTVKATLAVPLNDATNTDSYIVRGSITSPEVTLEGLKLLNVAADVVYANGKLELTSLTAKLPPDSPDGEGGTLSGSATAAVSPQGDLKANVKFTRLPLGTVLKAVPGGVDARGAVTGSADFTSPVNTINDPATWNGSATLTAPSLTAAGRTITDVDVNVTLTKGTATLTKAAGVVEGIPLSGSGTLALTNRYAFTATVATRPQEASELQQLVPELELPVAITGKLTTDAKAEGTLNPLSLTASGSVSAADLTIGETRAEKLSAMWNLTPERFVLSELTAVVFKGTITGTADVPLSAEGKGDFAVTFDKVDAGAVAKAFPSVPVKLTGEVSGGVKGVIPVAEPGEDRAIAAEVNLSAEKLTVQGIPAEELVGKLSLAGSAVKYDLEGKTLGGSFEVNGRYPPTPPERNEPSTEEGGRIEVKNIDLALVAEVLRMTSPFRGFVDFTFTHDGGFQNGSGRYVVRGLGYGKERLVNEIRGRVRVRNGRFEAGDIVGPISAGTIRARVQASLSQPTRNSFSLDVDRLNVGRVLEVFAGLDPTFIDGGISLVARGKLYPEFTATGTIGLANGRVAGLSASNVRAPFSLQIRERGGRLRVPELTGTVGNGRVSGEFEFDWGAIGRLDAELKFTGVKVGNVLSDFKQANYFGGARLTGTVKLKGQNIRSANDLSGSVVAKIGQAAVRDLPVLDTISPFVSPTALVKPFDAGELRARLSRGVFRIERLTLASPSADLYADGTISTAGKIDLGVVVRTGTIGLNDQLLTELGLAVTLPAVLPLQIVRDVSVFLSNRTVRLNIGGTLDHPQPRLNAAALLTDEAIRFLLRRYLPVASAVIPEVKTNLRR